VPSQRSQKTYNWLISFLSRNNIVTEAENEYRKEPSTETVIHFLLENITGVYFLEREGEAGSKTPKLI
jgi:hypothetical protein